MKNIELLKDAITKLNLFSRKVVPLALVFLLAVGCAAQPQQSPSADPLEPPVYYSGGLSRPSSAEEDRYADQPNLAVIHQYVTTGRMPTEVQPMDAGRPWGCLERPRPGSPALKRQ